MRTPKRYENAKYEDVPQNIRQIFEKMRTSRKGIYIHGGVGTGKTHIIHALNKKMYESEILSKVYNIPELLREIKLDFGREEAEKTKTEERIMEYGSLLIFDDIGSERMTEWVEETFYLIVNRRYNDMMPTIFTSNLNLAELAEKVGDRVASRIAEMCEIVELKGEDRRLN